MGTEFESDLNLPINDVIGEAFEALGENGIICLAKEHECSECSKPYKQPDGQIVPNAAPVKMVVLDGIVMGPTVSSFSSRKKNCCILFTMKFLVLCISWMPR